LLFVNKYLLKIIYIFY